MTTTFFPDTDTHLLLDEEFDRVSAGSALDHAAAGPALLADDRAWDDQLDEGEEMSL